MSENIKADLLENKIQLPLFDGTTILPTGKYHVSYSEISVHTECSYRHKLQYVDKIVLDHGSIHTEYGRTVHDLLEEFLRDRNSLTPEACVGAQEKFYKLCADLEKETGKPILVEEQVEFGKSIPDVAMAVPEFLDSEFPGWQPVAAEFNLFEPVVGQKNKWFKGFIDSVIKVPRKRPKKIISNDEGEVEISSKPLRFSDMKNFAEQSTEIKKPIVDNINWQYYIFDWKTTGHGWTPDKKRDFNKQLQLILYKHFFCSIFGLDLDDVKCGFVLLKRTKRKSDNSRVELVPVSVGPKTEEKALKVLGNMINQVNSKRTMKNRNSCRYCPYNGTEHCT